jgi:hypothetical protein
MCVWGGHEGTRLLLQVSDRASHWPGAAAQPQRTNRLSTLPKGYVCGVCGVCVKGVSRFIRWLRHHIVAPSCGFPRPVGQGSLRRAWGKRPRLAVVCGGLKGPRLRVHLGPSLPAIKSTGSWVRDSGPLRGCCVGCCIAARHVCTHEPVRVETLEDCSMGVVGRRIGGCPPSAGLGEGYLAAGPGGQEHDISAGSTCADEE